MSPLTHAFYSIPKFHPDLYSPEAALQAEFGRLIHAAIISPSFKKELLSNPVSSIEKGYCGETFHIPAEVISRIHNIRAGSLEDFSAQLMKVATTSRRVKESAVASYQ